MCGEFGLRFYAAAPLQTLDGYNPGTLCVIDKKQRYLTNAQKEMLAELTAIVMDEIELRLAARTSLAASYERIASLEKEIKELQSKLT